MPNAMIDAKSLSSVLELEPQLEQTEQMLRSEYGGANESSTSTTGGDEDDTKTREREYGSVLRLETPKQRQQRVMDAVTSESKRSGRSRQLVATDLYNLRLQELRSVLQPLTARLKTHGLNDMRDLDRLKPLQQSLASALEQAQDVQALYTLYLNVPSEAARYAAVLNRGTRSETTLQKEMGKFQKLLRTLHESSMLLAVVRSRLQRQRLARINKQRTPNIAKTNSSSDLSSPFMTSSGRTRTPSFNSNGSRSTQVLPLGEISTTASASDKAAGGYEESSSAFYRRGLRLLMTMLAKFEEAYAQFVLDFTVSIEEDAIDIDGMSMDAELLLNFVSLVHDLWRELKPHMSREQKADLISPLSDLLATKHVLKEALLRLC